MTSEHLAAEGSKQGHSRCFAAGPRSSASASRKKADLDGSTLVSAAYQPVEKESR
jgi:hypothetical protein